MRWIDRPRRSAFVVAIAAMLMHLAVLPIRRPLILPDEAGFLLNARRLASGAPPSGLNYFPGYSVLIAPLSSATSTIASLTALVQVLNGALLVAAALLAMQLARRLHPTISEPAVTAIGLITAAYPAYRLFAAFALSENVLVPWTVLLCLALERSLRRSSSADAALFGLCAGLSLSIHTRALGLTVAALGTSAVWLRGRQLIAALAATSGGVVAAVALVSYTLDTSVDSGAARDSPGSLLRDAASLRGSLDVVTSALGQSLYLLVATFGLAGLGVWWFADTVLHYRSIRGDGDIDDAAMRTTRVRAAVGTLALGLLTASLGISSLFLAGREGDFAIYGRYGEGVLLPFVVAGLVAVDSWRKLPVRRLFALAVAMPSLAGLLVIIRGPEAFQGRTLLLNIAGVFPVVDTVGSIRLSTIALFGVVSLGLLVVVVRWRAGAAVVVVLLTFVATSMFSINRSADAIEILEQQDDLIAVFEALPDDVDCIALDIWQLPDRWHQENYRLVLDDQDFRYWSSATPAPPCSDLIVSQRSDLDEVLPGAAVVAVEPLGRQALWVLPGETRDQLEQVGLVPIESPLDVLPADQTVVVTLTVQPTTSAIDEPLDISITVTNQGPAGLFPELAFADVAGSVNIGLEIRAADAPTVRRHEPIRFRLTSALAPGDIEHVTTSLRPLDIDPGLEPGSHVLVASLVQEGIAWTDLAAEVAVEIEP